MPGWLPALVAAAGSGLALLLAFPPANLWWLAPVGVALLGVATYHCRPVAAAGLGAIAGLICFVPLLAWTNLHTGVTPWLLLAGSQAGYIALLAAATGLASPLVTRAPARQPATPRPIALALLIAGLWTAQEAVRDRAPFGGFPWGRLAFSQGDSPLLRLAALGGAPLVTFAVALLGGLIAGFALTPWPATARRDTCAPATAWRGLRARALAGAALPGAAAVLLVLGAWLVPLAAPPGPAVRVAIIQGNVPRLGLDFNAQRRAVLDNHVAATLDLARRVEGGDADRPDLVIWPENSSDIDPLANPDAAERIDTAATAIQAPILVGAVLDDGPDRSLNAGLVWEPGRGVTQRYVKRHPVPFAEYMPLRPVARLISDKVDLLTTEFSAGHRPGLLSMGPVTVGDVICFEVAYDNIVRDVATRRADIIVVQTNNATFNAAEAAQQMAMVRLRAVEHGRPALMASTVGISGFVDVNGHVSGRTRFNARAVEVDELRVGSAGTLATRLGSWPEWVIAAATLAALVLAVRVRLRRPVAEGRSGGRRTVE